MEEQTNPESTDSEIEELFEETQEETIEEGDKDVEGKSEVENLTLSELNTIAGRKDNPFKSKEEYLKHYENLKKLVGDQDLAKERKGKKEVKEVKEDPTAKELAELKKDIAKKDFLLETPTAKEYLDLVEAYAEKHGLSLSEAWENKFASIADISQRKVIINKNRVNPVESQRINDLAKSARSGNESAQNALIDELVWKK